MAQIVAHVEGMEFLREQLRDVAPREARAILRRTVTKLAASLRKAIKAAAPVDTGTLRRAITSRREKGERDQAAASVRITRGKGAKHDAWYWHFVEFGTRMKPARPFITPAVERARQTLRVHFETEFFHQLQKQLEKRAKRQRL